MRNSGVWFAALFTACGASAQTAEVAEGGQLEEVIVTAERRVSTAQKTAAAISVRSGDELLSQGRYSLESILEDVPGLVGGAAQNSGTASGSGSDNPARGLTIRGIQSNVGTGGSTISAASAAAIYVDDVYNGIGGNYDIDRVEVLRGPQGTLYGRSATSGVVAIRTKAPDPSEFGADVSLEVGNYDLRHATGNANVPLVEDKVALRVSGNSYERDSFYSTNGGGWQSSTDGRAKLLFQPTDHLSATVGVAFQENRTRSSGVSITQPQPDRFVIANIPWARSENASRQYWAVLDLDLGNVAISYIPALRTWKQEGDNITRGATPVDQTGRTPKDRFHTQELRIRSNNDSPLQWQTGAMYYDNALEDENEVRFYPSGALAFRSKTSKDTTAAGVFAEANWALTPETRLTAGARYDHTKVATEQDYTSQLLITRTLSGDEGIREFDNVTYKVRLEHDMTSANMVYALVATGFSPGDVAVTTNAALQPEVVRLDAETLTSYEVGSKNRFADGRLQINGALYYYDYGAYQVANINLTPGSPSRTFSTIAIPLTTYGGELEALARPWENGQFSATLAYTQAQYEDIPDRFDYLFGFDSVPGVPPFEASASYNHTVPLAPGMNLLLGGSVRFASAHDAGRVADAHLQYGARDYVHVENETTVDLNARFAFANGKYSITGYVRNLTDNRHKVYAGTIGGTLVESAGPTGVNSTAALNDPRTWGVIVTGHF